MIPVVVSDELEERGVEVLLAEGDRHLNQWLSPAGASRISCRLVNRKRESSRGVRIVRASEPDSEFASHGRNDGYEISPNESRYDQRAVRGAFCFSKEKQQPTVNTKR
jgi:hypothetical protein